MVVLFLDITSFTRVDFVKTIYFEVLSRLGKRIRTTTSYWNLLISVKHTTMKNKENSVKEALSNPDEIRQSRRDHTVFIYYKKINGNFAAVVCKHLNGEGHIITAYVTSRIMEGVSVWKR